MKVLLVLAAVAVLGGNAHTPSRSFSGIFGGIADYGRHMAFNIASMMDEGFYKFLAGQEDLITSRQSKDSNFDENILQNCQFEYRNMQAQIYENLHRNLHRCVQAAGDKMDVKVNVGRLIAPVRICLDESRDPSDSIQCFIDAALAGPHWDRRMDKLARFIGASVNGLMANLPAAASEGVECAFREVKKARETSAVKKFTDCISANYRRDPVINWPESWRNGPATDLDHPRADGPGADGPEAHGPGADGPEAHGPGADGPGADSPGAHGPRADGPGAHSLRADGPVRLQNRLP